MARIDVPFVVKKQDIKQHPKNKIAAGGKNYFYATFDLCETWSDIKDTVKAVFTRDGVGTFAIELVDGANNCMECKIPWEVMVDAGYFDVGIFGGSVLPSSTARVFVIRGSAGDGEEPQPPTPDWFTKMEQQIGDIASILETI